MQALHRFVQSLRIRQRIAHLILKNLSIEQLFAVLPFVQSLRLVEALVTLHADQGQAKPLCSRQCQLGFPNTG